jgi:hypothetical protein
MATPVMLSAVLTGTLASTAASQTPPTCRTARRTRGEPARQRTSVWIAYDDEALYFAFRCFDEEPSKIRTTITRRDNAWNDDWIGVSLDSTHAGQVAYHMFVNPSGIQIDALSTGNNEDSAADWVWQSAGRVDTQGYVVEMRVPLQSIRFRGGADVRMGVLFFRHSSRMGVAWSWPAIAPGQWYELMPGTVAHAGYGSILESINSDRDTPTARALFFKVSYLARL